MSVREFAAYVHDWETPALAAEVQNILDAIDAPPIDDHGLFTFQKILYRRKWFDYDAHGQIILTCRCILESEGNEGAFSEPFVSAVHSVCSKTEFADRGLELVEAFDQIRLVEILETMRRLEFFHLSDVPSALCQIVRNKVRRVLFPPAPEPVKAPSTKERLEAGKQATAAARLAEVERNLEIGRKLLALFAKTPCNKEFGRLRVRHFDIDQQHVSAMIRATRLYGDRPEIHRKVSWRALVGLSSTTMLESRREAFERRILAGENVRANEITRRPVAGA